jgi:formate hydrogenlyase subunit 3/multisubunit Na+/H+ antiporter MnhD subunit
VIDYLLAGTVFLLIAASVLLVALHRVLPALISAWVAVAAVALAFLATAALWLPLQSGALSLLLFEWSPGSGLSVPLALRVDAFSYLLLLTTLAASFVTLFSRAARASGARGQAAGARGQESEVANPESTAIIVPESTYVAKLPNADENVNPATDSEATAEAKDIVAIDVAEDVRVAADSEINADAEDANAGTGSPNPQPPVPSPRLKVAPGETLAAGWTLGLVAAMALLLLAGNAPTIYFAWTLIGLCAFAGRLSTADSDDDLQSARQFIVVDLLAGYCLLAAVALSWSASGAGFPSPATLLAANGAWVVALWTVPALARSLQYPFSRFVVLGAQSRADATGLSQALVFAISGTYLLLRALASVPEGGEQIRALLLVLATVTAAYGLVMLARESALERLASWTMVVALGLACACFALGGFTATMAGLVIIVTHALGRVALGIALEERRLDAAGSNAVLALAVVSLGGLPPLAGFWGYWTMASVGVTQGHALAFLLPVLSLPLVAWRLLRALDKALAEAEGKRANGWTMTCGKLPIAVLALLAVTPAALAQALVEPAVRAATGANDHLFSLAVPGGTNSLSGWLAVLALCVLLGAIWLVWRADPVPEMRKRLGLTPDSSQRRVSRRRAAPYGAGELSWLATAERWLSQPEFTARDLKSLVFGVGNGLGLAVEGIEDSYYAPAMVIGVVVVLLVFLG